MKNRKPKAGITNLRPANVRAKPEISKMRPRYGEIILMYFDTWRVYRSQASGPSYLITVSHLSSPELTVVHSPFGVAPPALGVQKAWMVSLNFFESSG